MITIPNEADANSSNRSMFEAKPSLQDLKNFAAAEYEIIITK